MDLQTEAAGKEKKGGHFGPPLETIHRADNNLEGSSELAKASQ